MGCEMAGGQSEGVIPGCVQRMSKEKSLSVIKWGEHIRMLLDHGYHNR